MKKEQKRKRKPRLFPETIEKIIKLHQDPEFLEAGEIAQVLGIPERDVVWVIHPHY